MSATSTTSSSADLYTAAHAAQYTTKDLGAALQLYRELIDTHADAQEAAFSRVQIQNIVNAAVPKQVLFDAQVELAMHHIEGAGK